ncbi:P27 family phage terminase small subunit [Shewanella algae]|uniref:P27 family phage terminase small subunit n=1 Tax=Shewanella algae TaxID=38313 RepID=UPI00313D857C
MAKITSVPRQLTDRSKQIYRELVKQNSHLEDSDRELLAQYCSTLARIEKISEELDSGELMVSVGGDRKQRSPYIGLLNQQQATAIALAKELALTPMARKRANIDNTKQDNKDPFDQLLNDLMNGDGYGEDDEQ